MIDCLPNMWMLDGVLVTAAERDQVSRFFKNSEVLERPVRHKLRPVAHSKFVPSHIKHLKQRAVLGEFINISDISDLIFSRWCKQLSGKQTLGLN